jgi:hypothetical protein
MSSNALQYDELRLTTLVRGFKRRGSSKAFTKAAFHSTNFERVLLADEARFESVMSRTASIPLQAGDHLTWPVHVAGRLTVDGNLWRLVVPAIGSLDFDWNRVTGHDCRIHDTLN